MRGKLISSRRLQYEEGGFRKYIDILPDTDVAHLKCGDEIEFEIVAKLNEGVTYTSEDGWDRNPIEGYYAKVIDEWEQLEEEYLKDEYPVFGGPFTDSKTPWEWLKLYYNSPTRKK